MTYTVLFLGTPVVGVLLYFVLVWLMLTRQVPSPPIVELFFVFAAYGAVLLFLISEHFGEWSGMHSIGAVGLVLVGLPLLVVLGVLSCRRWSVSAFHRMTAVLCFALPLAGAVICYQLLKR